MRSRSRRCCTRLAAARCSRMCWRRRTRPAPTIGRRGRPGPRTRWQQKRAHLRRRRRFSSRRERRGTAHAVLSARKAIARGADDILVMFADTPLVRAETLAKLRSALAEGAAVAVLGFQARRSARLRPAGDARRRTRRHPRRARCDAGRAQDRLLQWRPDGACRQARARHPRAASAMPMPKANTISPMRLPSPAIWG